MQQPFMKVLSTNIRQTGYAYMVRLLQTQNVKSAKMENQCDMKPVKVKADGHNVHSIMEVQQPNYRSQQIRFSSYLLYWSNSIRLYYL